MLSPQQQELILENKWIINTVAKRLSITDEDIKNELMLFMCNTIEKYDPAKGVKLGTYLFRSVYLRALRLLKNESQYKNRYIISEFITKREVRIRDGRMSMLIECIDTQQERDIVSLYLQGYKRQEIADKLGIKRYKVEQIKRELIQRTREIYDLSPKLPK